MNKDNKYWAPYGWLHSCGELFYQLDCPGDCEKCSKKGGWSWYEEAPYKKETDHSTY